MSFRALSRPQFSQLQQKIFPVYFALQAVLPLLVLLSRPAASTRVAASATASSGVLASDAAVPMAAVFAVAAANLLVCGPATVRVIHERKHQETRDGKKSYDAPPHSEAMQQLNRRFSMLHGASSLLNLAAVVATLVYGFRLGTHLSM